jgi:hypothetical protein
MVRIFFMGSPQFSLIENRGYVRRNLTKRFSKGMQAAQAYLQLTPPRQFSSRLLGLLVKAVLIVYRITFIISTPYLGQEPSDRQTLRSLPVAALVALITRLWMRHGDTFAGSEIASLKDRQCDLCRHNYCLINFR